MQGVLPQISTQVEHSVGSCFGVSWRTHLVVAGCPIHMDHTLLAGGAAGCAVPCLAEWQLLLQLCPHVRTSSHLPHRISIGRLGVTHDLHPWWKSRAVVRDLPFLLQKSRFACLKTGQPGIAMMA